VHVEADVKVRQGRVEHLKVRVGDVLKHERGGLGEGVPHNVKQLDDVHAAVQLGGCGSGCVAVAVWQCVWQGGSVCGSVWQCVAGWQGVAGCDSVAVAGWQGVWQCVWQWQCGSGSVAGGVAVCVVVGGSVAVW
jgi:hypothetical protein